MENGKQKKKQLILTLAHILLWIFVCLFFCTFSFLRPMAMSYWKEILSSLIVAGMVYVNCFLLVPKYFLKGRHKLFWIHALTLVVVTVIAEMMLVYSDIRTRAFYLSPEQLKTQYCVSFFLLLLRNTSFSLFFLLYKLYHTNALLFEDVKKLITQKVYQMIVFSPKNKPLLIEFKDIAFFTYDGDRLFLIMKNGKQIEQPGTLSELEELIPSEHWIRANRQTLVMRDSIVRYNSSALVVNLNGYEQTIPYFTTKSTEIFKLLKNWNPNLYTLENFKKEDKIQEQTMTLPEDLRQLQKYLQKYPEANSTQVANVFHCSIRTAQRNIAKLRQMTN